MYNNSYYPGYRPYPQPNTLPPQQVIQVNGKASVDSIQMSPNSSVLLMDTSAPVVWLCVSDGVGRVTATPYDITEHKDETTTSAQNLEERLASVELAISKMEAKINARKPDASDLVLE